MENFYHTLGIFIFAILVLKLWFRRNQNLPPTPLSLPIIGHLHLLKNPLLHESLQKLSSQHGPILYLKLGSRPALVVSSPSLAQECFTKNDVIFANRPKTMGADHFTYDYTSYVWAPYGDLWRTLRRVTVVKLFAPKSLQRFSPVREGEVRCLLRRLFKASADGTQQVDLKFLFSLLTTNVMVRTLVGRRYIEEGVAAAGTVIEKQLFKEFKDKFYPSLGMTICDFFPILRWFGYKGLEKTMIKLHSRRDEFLQNLIDEMRSRKKSDFSMETDDQIPDGTVNKSLTEILLSLQESEPDFYTDKVIKSLMMITLIAGTETSAITLEWAMSLLLNHPKALQKVKTEIDNNVGHGRILNDSDLANLPFLRCVVNETLRLYPPAPLLLPHCASEPCAVGGYEVPQGTMLMVNAWALQRDRKVWEDPDEFKPERFEVEAGEQRESGAFIAFGMGRRACPGEGLALRMVALALGGAIQCFEWEKVEEDMRCNPGMSLNKTIPLEALCCPRQCMVQLLSSL